MSSSRHQVASINNSSCKHKIKMDKGYSLVPSVRLERLSPAVIDALGGNVVQNFKMLQSLPTLNMTMLSMLLRRKVENQAQIPVVVLKRLPEDFRSTQVALNICPSLISQKKQTIKPSAKSRKSQHNMNINKAKALQVSLKRLPKNIINLLTQKKVLCAAKNEKRRVGHPKKNMHRG